MMNKDIKMILFVPFLSGSYMRNLGSTELPMLHNRTILVLVIPFSECRILESHFESEV